DNKIHAMLTKINQIQVALHSRILSRTQIVRRVFFFSELYFSVRTFVVPAQNSRLSRNCALEQRGVCQGALT
ncbi:MAG: hypothetical protein ACKPKO_35480, partial [Candidatus Fonsibacter sp.]